MNSHEKDRILIVDDTPANIDVLGAILSDEFDISVAVNGSMALDIAKSDSPPDLILLDIMMPEMDGYEVAKHLKSRHSTQKIPIIFVTAKIEDTDEALGFQVGAVDYIRKPITPSVTLARIKSQLELKKYRDHLANLVEEKTSQIQDSQKQLSVITEDLVDKKIAAHKNQVYFKELFMNSPYGIILIGNDNRIIRSNNSFSSLLGYSIGEILNRKFSGFSDQKEDSTLHKNLIQKALNGETHSMEMRCIHKKGYQIPISALAYPVKVNGQVQGVFVFYENISQRKLFEEKLKHQAYHDALTGIPNRLLFGERLDCAIEKQKRDPDFRFSVLLVDLDRFKSVNDSLGHQAGDTLLKAVTSRIRKCLRTKDTLARLGGDEFAVLLPYVEDTETVSDIASRIKDASEATFVIQDHEVHISASIGIVMETNKYEDANQLLRDADLAMYNAKDSGKAQFKFFAPGMHERLMQSVTIEKELRLAIEKQHLELFFQPIINVKTRSPEGFEALIRWQHPQKGLVFPDHFIPVAEDTGLIIPMGDWIIEQACQNLARWEEIFDRPFSVHINISVKQFLHPAFCEHLCNTVKKFNLSPSHIKLEFTESLLMEHTRSAVDTLTSLKKFGFILSIDDFGTGYSSLSYLQQFPIDQIKIDRSFVSSMEQRADSFEIVKSVLSLSKSLGLSTVAEGVETESQLETLFDLDCESAQGYYFAKPMRASQTTAYLKKTDT